MISTATSKVLQDPDNDSEEFLIASVIANRSNGISEKAEQERLAKIVAAGDGDIALREETCNSTATLKSKKTTTRRPRRTRTTNGGDRLELLEASDEAEAQAAAWLLAASANARSDPDLAIMKVVAARSLEFEEDNSSISGSDSSSSEFERDRKEADDEGEDKPSSRAAQFIAQHSRNAKKRIEGPLQPGAYEAAPGEPLCRLGTLSYSEINNHNRHNTKSLGHLVEEGEHPMVARLQRKLTKERKQLECLKASITTPTLILDDEASPQLDDPLTSAEQYQQQQALHLASATLIEDYCCCNGGKETSMQNIKVLIKEKHEQLQQMEKELEEMRQRLRDHDNYQDTTKSFIPQQERPPLMSQESPSSIIRKEGQQKSEAALASSRFSHSGQEQQQQQQAPDQKTESKQQPRKPRTIHRRAKTTGTYCNNSSKAGTDFSANGGFRSGYKYHPKMTPGENFTTEFLLMPDNSHSQRGEPRSRRSSRRSRSKERVSLFLTSVQRISISRSKSRSRSPTRSNKDEDQQKPPNDKRRSRSQDKKSGNSWMGLFAN